MYLDFFVILQNTVDYTAKPAYPLASVGQLLYIIIAFAFVALLAYYSTKWIASAKHLKQSSGNIQIIEHMLVGHQNSVQLVKVGKKYVLIGVTKEHVTLLTELTEEDIVLKATGQPVTMFPFEKVFKQLIEKNKDENENENKDEIKDENKDR